MLGNGHATHIRRSENNTMLCVKCPAMKINIRMPWVGISAKFIMGVRRGGGTGAILILGCDLYKFVEIDHF